MHKDAGICHGRKLVFLGPGLALDMPPARKLVFLGPGLALDMAPAIRVHPVLLGPIFPLSARLPVIPSATPVFPVWPSSTLQLPVLPATQCAVTVQSVGVENMHLQSAPIQPTLFAAHARLVVLGSMPLLSALPLPMQSV
jgi:hypothetical protein